MEKRKRQSFLGGAMILTVAMAITKVIGALYKIPLGNLLDKEGMAHFYAAYNIYNLLLTLSTAGLPLALSRMVSHAEALGQENQKHRVFHVAAALFCIAGVICGGSMFFLSGPLSHLLHDSLAQLSVQLLSPAVFCVCMMSAIRGYTQGQGNMRPTAVSEVIESLCKAVVGFFLAWWLLGHGQPRHIASAGAIAGVTVGTMASLLALVIYLIPRRYRRKSDDVPQGRREILRQLLSIGIPVTIGACGMSLLNLLDTSLVLGTLQNALGQSEEAATALYGEYTYGMNLFALPAAFIYPVTISLIPAISAARARHDEVGARRHTASAFRVTALLVFPAGVGLSVLAHPILNLLYPDIPQTAAAAAEHLTVLGIASIFVCLMTLSNGILQAYGKEKIPIVTLLCGGVVKIIANYLLVGNPDIGIHGAAYSTLCCYALIVVLNMIAVVRTVHPQWKAIGIILRPMAAAAVMGVGAYCAYRVASRWSDSRMVVLAVILLAMVVYGVLAISLGAISKEDLKSIPKGEKIANILHIR